MLSPKATPRQVAASTSQMKGIGFTNVRQFVLDKHGDERWRSIVAALDADDRSAVESVVPVGWYDVHIFARLLRAIDTQCGRGDLELLPEVGAYEAEHDFNRALRLLVRVLHPSAIFAAERRLWSHFQDTGRWTFKPITRGMEGMLEGWAADAALCAELSGYLVRLVEFTGGKDVSVEHLQCRGRSGSRCVYNFHWK